MIWKCPNCWTEYEVDKKYEAALKDKKDCKFCVRKDPDVPTTAEMDGLLTQEDMRNRFKVVMQCKNCKKWTTMNHPEPMKTEIIPCEGCGQKNYDSTSIKSLRTYNPLTDNKRKPK
jgi:hypothetical protein